MGDEPIGALGDVEILSSDLRIFRPWISSVFDGVNGLSTCFISVAGAVSGGAWRIDAACHADSWEAGRHSSAHLAIVFHPALLNLVDQVFIRQCPYAGRQGPHPR
jgi:hypothetical protein